MNNAPAIVAVGLTLGATPAAAAEARLGLFVGNNVGASDQGRLVFAASDADKMRDLFIGFGGVAPADAWLLQDQPSRTLITTFDAIRARVAAVEARGDHAVFVFYYSGHGDDEGLQFGASRVGHEELRALIEGTGADVRLVFLDACRSGAAVRAKGGVRGPGYAFAVDVQRAEGSAWLTSSAASEFSQESDEVGGGFFTYYLHSGLAGAADLDGDEVVTLDEVSRWVHTETVFRTRTAPGAQTPSYDLDLTGSGGLVLTRTTPDSARISFPATMSGTYAVWDESRKRYVAEVHAGGAVVTVAVPAGTFAIEQRQPGWVDQATVSVRAGERASVDPAAFASIAYEQTAARGDLRQAVRRAARPDLTVLAALGQQSFGGDGGAYVPAHGIGGVQIDGRFRNGLWGQAEVLAGSSPAAVTFADLGEVRLNVGSASVGGSLGVWTGGRWAHAGLGARAATAWFWRSFPDGQAAPQTSWTVSPGVTGLIGAHSRHLRADLGVSAMLSTADWDGTGVRSYRESTLRFGYAF